MEFVNFQSACDELRHLGVAPTADDHSAGRAVRFQMSIVPKVTPNVAKIIVACDGAPTDREGDADAIVVRTERGRLADLAESVGDLVKETGSQIGELVPKLENPSRDEE